METWERSSYFSPRLKLTQEEHGVLLCCISMQTRMEVGINPIQKLCFGGYQHPEAHRAACYLLNFKSKIEEATAGVCRRSLVCKYLKNQFPQHIN